MMNYKLKPLPLHPRIHKTPMTKKKQIDQLNRLVNLISDDCELLSRASTFMQNLVDSRTVVNGKQDLSSQLSEQAQRDAKNERPQ